MTSLSCWITTTVAPTRGAPSLSATTPVKTREGSARPSDQLPIVNARVDARRQIERRILRVAISATFWTNRMPKPVRADVLAIFLIYNKLHSGASLQIVKRDGRCATGVTNGRATWSNAVISSVGFAKPCLETYIPAFVRSTIGPVQTDNLTGQ